MVFHETFKTFGGRLDTSGIDDPAPWRGCDTTESIPVVSGTCPPPSRSVFELHRRRAARLGRFVVARNPPRPGAPALHLDYVADQELNARAVHVPGFDFVGINSGTVPMFYCVFARMLHSPNCLPHVGNTSGSLKRPVDHVKEPLTSWLDLSGMVGPEDPVRNGLAIELALLAFDYFVFHEIGHLWNGHLDLLTQYGVLDMNEVAELNLARGGLMRQCIEMDADAFAITILTRDVMRRPRPTAEGHLGIMYRDRRSAIFYLVFALYTTWRLLTPFAVDPASMAYLTHLPPALRQISNGANVLAVLELAQDIETAEALPRIFTEVMNEVEVAFAAMTDTDIDFSGRTYAVTPAANAHAKQVYAIWRELYPLLEPLARYDGLTPRPT